MDPRGKSGGTRPSGSRRRYAASPAACRTTNASSSRSGFGRAWPLIAALLLALALPLAAQQPNAGEAVVGMEALVQTGIGAPSTPGMGPDQFGLLGSFQQSFGADGVFTLNFDSATDGSAWRDGNNQLAWRNLPFAGGRWFFRAGTINFATDLLPLHFASLFAPSVYLSGGAVEYHFNAVHITFFAGRELIQQGPYLPFFTSTPSGIGGVQALFAPLHHLTLEARYYHSRSSGPATVADPLLAQLPAAADNFFLDGDYHLGRDDDWLGELSFSRAQPEVASGPAASQDSLSYFFGPILSRPDFDLQAYAIRESADYLPLANYISGDRTGGFASLDVHPSTRWSLSSTVADYRASAVGAAAFSSSDAFTTSGAASYVPGDGYSLTASASRSLISPTEGAFGPSLGLTTAQLQGSRAYGDNRSYLRFQDWVSSSSEPGGNSSVRTSSFEQDRLIGADSLSAIVSLQQSSGGVVTLNGELGGNLALSHWFSLSGSAQLGRDLRDQTALTLETYRTIMVLAAVHLPRQFDLSAQWIHNASVSQLNPASVLVGLAAGPVALLPALSQQTLLVRLTKSIHWGHGMPLLAGLSEAEAERLVPTYSTVSGIVFNDRSGTGAWAPGDTGVAGIEVTLSGRTAITDAQGRFQFPAVRSGEYRLALDMDHLPAQYSAPAATPQTVRVGAGATPRIAIPIQVVGSVGGQVQADGRPLAGAALRLVPARGAQNWASEPMAVTGAQGSFQFEDVLPGAYQLELDPASLPSGAALAAPPPPLTVTSGGTVRGLVLRLSVPVRHQAVHTIVEAAETIAPPAAPGTASAARAVLGPARAAAAAMAPSPSPSGPFPQKTSNIYFAFARWNLNSAALQTLRQDASWLRAHPAADMLIEGFCDSRGSAQYNRWLGQRRADSARNYLIRHGVAASRIRTISYGSERQWCTDSTRICGRSNRRDHLVSILLAAGGGR